jgi:enoyl-CoA hydratase/carnithine racemase
MGAKINHLNLELDGHVSVTDRDGVRYVVLNRTDKKNAITNAMWTELARALETAAPDGCGALLIMSSASIFTAGNDLGDFLAAPPRDADAPVFRFLRSLVQIPIPVVAAVRGAAVGVGATLLLHCDLVYVTESAKLKLPFVDLGLVPEAASSVLLARTIGRARAGAAIYLGEALSAADALAHGIATAVVADEHLEETASQAALAIARKPRAAVIETKQLMNHDREHILATIAREGQAFMRRLDSDEARKAMSGFFAAPAAPRS